VVGALFGDHPYCTHLELYLEKTSEEIDDVDSSVMRRGRILESAVAAAVAEEKGWKPLKAVNYYRNPETRLGATPDYLVDTGGIAPLQCKTVDPRVFERSWEDGPPLWIALQALTEAMLLDAPCAWVGALVLKRDYPVFTYEIPRTPSAEARIIEAVQEFWARVDEKNMPAPNYARDSGAIAKLFPKDDGSVLDLTGDNLLPPLLAEFCCLRTEIKDRETRVEEIQAEVKDKLGTAAEAKLAGFKITHKTQTRQERIVKAATFRVLRITDLRDKEEKAT
jgi:predicted phage-related endonuclease